MKQLSEKAKLELKYIEQEIEHEKKCHRCGLCCGADNDPCANLQQDKYGYYYCMDYENRLGPQKTVSGNDFTCVHIREIARQDGLRLECGYRD